MQNLKIRVNNADESREVQELFFKLGFTWCGDSKDIFNFDMPEYIVNWNNGYITVGDDFNQNRKEITIPELRAMANPVKEYLMPSRNYEYILTDAREALEPHAEDWIAIPEGAIRARFYQYDPDALEFENSACQWWGDETKNWIDYMDYSKSLRDGRVVWQRATHPEELPFIDDKPKYTDDEVKYMDENGQGRLQSINDQYAEIERVRQATKDNVNHPSHYTQGKVECIDALESATIGKSGIEAVCVANIIKYLWRYEEKNGVEDVKKAKFYLNRLLATLENNNG